MSKAFTSEETVDEPVVPARAPLPDGVPNYVTPRGLRLLREELAALEAERARRDPALGDEDEQRRLAVLSQRQAALASRIASARVVDPATLTHDEVRFGATVTVRNADDGAERRFQIVGVDEADPAHGRIAFTSPIARAVMGCVVGDEATLDTAAGEEVLEVVAIEYDAADDDG